MVAPREPLFLRRTVIGGQTAPDDWQVIWDGLPIGRILKQRGMPAGNPNWSWSIILHRPQQSWQRGICSDLEECKRRFRVAWSAVHPKLTEADVEELRAGERDVKNRPWNRRR
jgi:hypothetical protein